MKKIIAIVITLMLVGYITSPVFSYSTIDADMCRKVLDYTLTVVEKAKLNVYANRQYKKHKDSPIYVLSNAIDICKMVEYERGFRSPYDAYYRKKANCAGFSFLFFMVLDKANIKSGIAYTKTHMWNEVYKGDKWVKYDLTALNKIF